MTTKEVKKSAALRPMAALPPGVDSLLSRAQVCAALGGISTRKLDRLLSSGEFPSADVTTIGHPKWRVATVNAAIQKLQ